ncbi:MAG TPA: DUF2325 domain-containing protein [Magnetospirillum sp.]|nr:DUF2325 domain-containing protein [Magnetospirillum sp.]
MTGKPINLHGRRVLFVGGRDRNAAFLRRRVEDCNGDFLYHDGGLQESMERLGSLLRRADLVLFPVECISHAALRKVKSECRRWDIPYVPLRHSGGEAVSSALHTLTQPQ